MALDGIAQIVADYERGGLTEASACLAIYLAAGDGDAYALFERLPKSLREAVAHDLTSANERILESYCGTATSELYTADLRRREETLRRGIIALQRVIASRPARPGGPGG